MKKIVQQVEIKEISVGALVEFDVGRDPKTGRRLAVNIRLVDA